MREYMHACVRARKTRNYIRKICLQQNKKSNLFSLQNYKHFIAVVAAAAGIEKQLLLCSLLGVSLSYAIISTL